MPTPPYSKELGRNSALATRTIKIDSNDRELLKFYIFVSKTLRIYI
jgi:hypothetical protein